MSAKKKREISEQEMAERELKKQEEAKAAKRTNLTYAVVGFLCVALCATMLVWNSGLIQRNAAALTINGQKYSAADVQYFYSATKSNIINYYLTNLGMLPFDYTASAKDQVYNTETGETWHDYIMSEAINSMTIAAAANEKAAAEGFTMSEEAKESMETIKADMDTAWIGTYASRDDYLHAVYGPYMTYSRYEELLEMDMLAMDYTNSVAEEFSYDDADYQEYYKANTDALDTFTFSQFTLRASIDTIDADGNAIEMTDEEREAKMAEAVAPVKGLAEEIKLMLEGGADPAVLAVQYADDLYSSSVHQKRVGTSVNSSYTEWAFDDAREVGDVTLAEYDGDTVHYYYVAVYEGRGLDESATASVRHVLVAAETDEGATEPTDEQYEAAYEKAEALMAQWEAGDANEASFSDMAMEHSADTSSASLGGLITGIHSNSGYVPEFQNWAIDPAREPGDTAIVQNTGSTIKGWHLMYYVSDGDPIWKTTANAAMFSQEYTAWSEELKSGYEATEGFGMKFVIA